MTSRLLVVDQLAQFLCNYLGLFALQFRNRFDGVVSQTGGIDLGDGDDFGILFCGKNEYWVAIRTTSGSDNAFTNAFAGLCFGDLVQRSRKTSL